MHISALCALGHILKENIICYTNYIECYTFLMEVSQVAQLVKNLPGNAGDLDSIPALGGPPGEGNSCPLQYSCLENFMDRGVWDTTVHVVTKESDMVE